MPALTRPIFLLGMMGAGKTSVGRLLAARRGASFIDLDARIERLFAASIPELFEQGVEYFRACERASLRSLLREPGFSGAAVVVATGGGIVEDPANLVDIASVGVSVYLEVSAPVLAARLSSPTEQEARPLLADTDGAALESRLEALLRARARSYRSASLCVDADALADEVAARVEAAVEAAVDPALATIPST